MKRSQESFYLNHLISLAEYAIRPLRSLYNAKNTYIYIIDCFVNKNLLSRFLLVAAIFAILKMAAYFGR